MPKKLDVPVQRINTIISGKRGITAETAVLLSRAFEVSAEFWMNLQAAFDIWHASRRLAAAK